MPEYLVHHGIDYTSAIDGEHKRVESGDVVSDLPEDAVTWLLGNEDISFPIVDDPDTALDVNPSAPVELPTLTPTAPEAPDAKE